jgi:hypothetical protein
MRLFKLSGGPIASAVGIAGDGAHESNAQAIPNSVKDVQTSRYHGGEVHQFGVRRVEEGVI